MHLHIRSTARNIRIAGEQQRRGASISYREFAHRKARAYWAPAMLLLLLQRVLCATWVCMCVCGHDRGLIELFLSIDGLLVMRYIRNGIKYILYTIWYQRARVYSLFFFFYVEGSLLSKVWKNEDGRFLKGIGTSRGAIFYLSRKQMSRWERCSGYLLMFTLWRWCIRGKNVG